MRDEDYQRLKKQAEGSVDDLVNLVQKYQRSNISVAEEIISYCRNGNFEVDYRFSNSKKENQIEDPTFYEGLEIYIAFKEVIKGVEGFTEKIQDTLPDLSKITGIDLSNNISWRRPPLLRDNKDYITIDQITFFEIIGLQVQRPKERYFSDTFNPEYSQGYLIDSSEEKVDPLVRVISLQFFPNPDEKSVNGHYSYNDDDGWKALEGIPQIVLPQLHMFNTPLEDLTLDCVPVIDNDPLDLNPPELEELAQLNHVEPPEDVELILPTYDPYSDVTALELNKDSYEDHIQNTIIDADNYQSDTETIE